MKKNLSFFISVLIFIVLFTETGLSLSNMGPVRYYAGVFLSDVSQFDLTAGRFSADLQVWVKWSGDSNRVPALTFANGELDKMEELARESLNGWNSVRWHVVGIFRGSFPLHRFPFDRQKLQIELEVPVKDGFILPDLAGSGMNSVFSITGWDYKPYFQASTIEHTYYTDFGSIYREGKPTAARGVIFTLEIVRPFLPNLIKFLLPLIIILLISMTSFFVQNVEVDMGLGITAFLAAVALHFALGESMPDVGYMVTADKFFVVSYVILFANIILSVIANRLYSVNEEKAIKFESWSWKILAGVTFFLMLSISIIDSLPEGRPAAPAAASKTRQASSRDLLTAYIPLFKSLNTYNILSGLLSRGLWAESTNGRKPFLLEEIPSLTNSYVRFLTDGGVEVTWKLKAGLRWGDGSAITSRDLEFSVMIESNQDIVKMTRPDDRTLVVTHGRKSNPVIQKFTVLPERTLGRIYKEMGHDGLWKYLATNAPAMDGPYILKSFTPQKAAVMVRNPYFAGDAPLIGRIVLSNMHTNLDVLINGGDADFGLNLSVATTAKVAGASNYIVRADPSESLYLLQPDTRNSALSDINLLRAIATAVDRNAAARLLFGPDAVRSDSTRPLGAQDFMVPAVIYDYNPALARDYLARTAVKPFRLICSETVARSPERAVVDRIYSDLRAAGLPVTLEVTSNSVATLFKNGDHGGLLYINREMVYNNPGLVWSPAARDGEVAELLELFDLTLYDERRLGISCRLQELAAEKLPVIPLAFGLYRTVARRTLINFNPMAVSGNMWWNVEDWAFAPEGK